MTIEQLRAIANQTEEQGGLQLVILTMPCPSGIGSRYPLRVRTPFGLCRWHPSGDPTKIMIYVELDKIKNYLSKEEVHGPTR